MVVGSGAAFSFNTHLVDVVSSHGSVEAAILWAKGGLYAVRSKVYIDATGDGDLCALAGAEYGKGESRIAR